MASSRVTVGHMSLRTYSREVTNSAADGGREPGPSQVQSVDRAIAILTREVTRTLRLLGVTGTAELNRSHVSLRR